MSPAQREEKACRERWRRFAKARKLVCVYCHSQYSFAGTPLSPRRFQVCSQTCYEAMRLEWKT